MRLNTPMMSERKLFVSLKVAEVCNLVCNYCYFFYKGDDSYDDHPAIMPQRMAEQAGRYLGEGARDLGIRTVQIAIHGGEPLMIGKKRFARYCELLHAGVSPHARLELGVQTNGTLLDEEWLEILQRHNVRLGISIDGPKHIHDAVRVDKKGRGSHDDVVRAFRLAQESHRKGRLSEAPSASIVIQPTSSAREVYEYIVHELGVTRMDFLPQRDHWDNYSPQSLALVASYSLELLDCWLREDNPNVNIRSLKHILAPFLTDLAVDIRSYYLADLTEALTIRSNGDVSPDDALPSLTQEYRNTGFNILTSTLTQFTSHGLWDGIRQTVTKPPKACAECEWVGVCGGGDLVTRFSKARGFDNPTIYCSRNKLLYERMRQYVCKFVDPKIIDARIQRSRDVMFTAA